MNPPKDFLSGIKAGSPIAIGYVPIAIAFGALAIETGLSVSEAVLMSVFVFAGASQFMAVSMILAGASALQIITATFFINLRHLIMSMAVNAELAEGSKAWKTALSFGITDETFALLTLREKVDQKQTTRFFTAGLMIVAYSGWVLGTTAGCVSVRVIPAAISAGMLIGLYAMFIGLLGPQMWKSIKISIIAVVSMLLNAIFQSFLEPGWAIVLATIMGALIGALLMGEQA
ncbi:MAG: AzlC family ABC transporter permease [Chloroflexota bacterium]|nr:AzlC family ABC transporter permease [Chloroflexota bacterium]